ncbi:unnamed protein product [Didymodactylos carnosus]|uniref:Uncharacterized protein n=1 Tax=Didymodactylos carnosus TaxID=1234261 RepID=A0A815CVK5_9BILA|nr:unnamed protein product [Didymodactylos carnosus]CAF1494983.1 unnamed protein product [Didymodactylos carnosus]CAF4091306.1 unnamed protein product [Didymodactylos carnosus]CAF4284120.1 unnamed protein product [Didymodactylos carnosus]
MNVNEFTVNTTEIFLNLTKNCMKVIHYPIFDDGNLIPSVPIRPCKQFIQNTGPNNSSLAFKCNLINAYRYLNITQSNQSIIYRNEYCLLCQQNRIFINNNTDTCHGPYYHLAVIPLHLVRYQPLSILFHSDFLSKRMQYSTEYPCTDKNKMYGIFVHDYSTMSNIHQDTINAMKCQTPIRILKNSVKILNNAFYLMCELILNSSNSSNILNSAIQWRMDS